MTIQVEFWRFSTCQLYTSLTFVAIYSRNVPYCRFFNVYFLYNFLLWKLKQKKNKTGVLLVLCNSHIPLKIKDPLLQIWFLPNLIRIFSDPNPWYISIKWIGATDKCKIKKNCFHFLNLFS